MTGEINQTMGCEIIKKGREGKKAQVYISRAQWLMNEKLNENHKVLFGGLALLPPV
jgi:hypothetical protein